MQALPNIPGYELIQRLGGGPLTSVYRARDLADDGECAVKVLREDWEDPSTAIKLLQREARACLAVRHPRLVRLLQAHVTRPPYYLVLELLPGESLRRRLRRDGRLDVPTAVWIIRQTAEALAALHQHGFLHGDVKPENIRLVRAGSASLIDLGFAHHPGENTYFFKKGYVLGTVNYLAPELCREDPRAETSSDLYSLGMTLFEMLSGKLPYPLGSLAETFERHCSLTPEDILTHVASLPPSLVTLLERLLSRQPEDRPRAAAVAQQLFAVESAALERRRAA